MGREDQFDYAKGDRFIGKKPDEVFNEIEQQNIWNEEESVSGPGSSMEQTEEIRKQLPQLFSLLKISTILDIPCGDFNWMRHIMHTSLKYTGADIVSKLIDKNNAQYQSETVTFINLDLLQDALGKHDLIFTRDCLVHLSFEDILKALNNIQRSGSTYFVTTTFPDEEKNKNIPTGGWRPLNFNLPPFNFPSPEILINEKCTEGNGLFKDKSLGVWKIDDLKIASV